MPDPRSSTPPGLDALIAHARQSRGPRIAELLTREPQRLQRLSAEAAGLYVDLARNALTLLDLDALLQFAHRSQLSERRGAMFRGDRINTTERRSVLHTALRLPRESRLIVDGEDVVAQVHGVLDRIAAFSDEVRGGRWLGSSGQPITDVVNIGIGGSHLGPQLACEALADFAAPHLRTHFLTSLDPMSWRRIAASLNPATTLVIVASKSWKTLETALNAMAVRDWFDAAGIRDAAVARHFVAVSTNVPAATAFGIAADNVFPFWDWVGGRYSVWSAIGLPVMLSIGPPAFRRMLAGAHQMDRHFLGEPFERNAPVLMALVSLWHALTLSAGSEAVLPYSDGLRRLPAYLQQLTMESNGKRVTVDGAPVALATAAVTWGEPGTESQHSFFQFLHQGTATIPVEFVLPVPGPDDGAGGRGGRAGGHGHRRDIALIANCLAQTDALLNGRTLEQAHESLLAQGKSPQEAAALAPHLVYPGNRPTSTILMDSLTPETFGALVALYEHRTATLGWLWNINSFDQWGVELGKERATRIQPMLEGDEGTAAAMGADPGTVELVRRVRGALRRR